MITLVAILAWLPMPMDAITSEMIHDATFNRFRVGRLGYELLAEQDA